MSAQQTVKLPDPIPTVYPVGYCYFCGAKLTNPSAFFCRGCDRKAEAKVVKEVYGSVPNFMAAHGYGPPRRAL